MPQCPGGLRDSFQKKPRRTDGFENNFLLCAGHCAKDFGQPEVRSFFSILFHKQKQIHTGLYLESTLGTGNLVPSREGNRVAEGQKWEESSLVHKKKKQSVCLLYFTTKNVYAQKVK